MRSIFIASIVVTWGSASIASAPIGDASYREGDRVVVTSNTSLRIGKEEVAIVDKGETLIVEDVQDGWVWVQVHGKYGWIQDKYLIPKARPKRLNVELDQAATFGRGRKWAIIVAINKYLDPQIPNLRYCVDDAHLLAQTLAGHCGYDERRILILADDQQEDHFKPLGINFRIQIRNWLKKAKSEDTMLVFFSGHGFLDARGQGFLAPKDCEKDNLGLTGLRVDELRDSMHQCRASQKVLLLDCCHSGGEKAAVPAGASSQELGLAFQKARGMLTLASCDKRERSWEWDEKGHGLFTYFLALGLRGGADYDGNRVIDGYELHRYTLDQVSLTAQRRLNAQQTPKLLLGEDVQGVFALARTAGNVVESESSLQRPTDGGLSPDDTGTMVPLKVTIKAEFSEFRIVESATAKKTLDLPLIGGHTQKSVLAFPGQPIVLTVDNDFNVIRFPDTMQGDIEIILNGEQNDVYCPRDTKGTVKLLGEGGFNTVRASEAMQQKIQVLGLGEFSSIVDIDRKKRNRKLKTPQ
jgi:hypothetical protein